MARKIGSRYTAHQILGRGSAGTVWLGEGPEGPVAIKLLREDLASDQELVGRFVQERTALLGLDHPHIVGVRDLVVDGNDLALVMDLVRGTDLRTRLDRERRLAPEAAVAIVADVADGLAAAHAAGVVHRDVKPENVLLDMQGPLGPGGSHPALLTDFGVAEARSTPRAAPGPRRSSARRTIWPRRSSRACRRARRSTSTRWRPSCTSCWRASRPSAAATPARSCAGTSRRPWCRCPASPTSCGSCSCSAWPRRPASRLRASRAGRAAARAAAAAGGDAAAGRGRARRGGRRGVRAGPGTAESRRAGRGAREAAVPTGERVRRGAVPLVPGAKPDSNRDTHTSMRVPGAGRAGGRGAGDGACAAACGRAAAGVGAASCFGAAAQGGVGGGWGGAGGGGRGRYVAGHVGRRRGGAPAGHEKLGTGGAVRGRFLAPAALTRPIPRGLPPPDPRCRP